jgi:L-asparagine transporter-like permease
MGVSSKTHTSRNLAIQYAFSFCVMIVGIALNHMGIGSTDFIFGSVGNWLIYIGALTALLATVSRFHKKEKIVDERMEKIGYRAYRISAIAFLLLAFSIMVADGISPIEVPYYLSMSYLICFYLVVYGVSYKWLERQN